MRLVSSARYSEFFPARGAVVGDGRRLILSAGLELCPHLVFVPLNFEKYNKKAQEIREIIAKFVPHPRPTL